MCTTSPQTALLPRDDVDVVATLNAGDHGGGQWRKPTGRAEDRNLDVGAEVHMRVRSSLAAGKIGEGGAFVIRCCARHLHRKHAGPPEEWRREDERWKCGLWNLGRRRQERGRHLRCAVRRCSCTPATRCLQIKSTAFSKVARATPSWRSAAPPSWGC